MHLKYDPYLSREDKTDMLELIRQKHMRNRRLQEYTLARRPELDRCMSWAGGHHPPESDDEAAACVRPNKAMSVDLSGLDKHSEKIANRLLGGADVSTFSKMPEIPENKESPKTEQEEDEEAENGRGSSERRRSLFTRSDAMSEDSSPGEEIRMRNMKDK